MAFELPIGWSAATVDSVVPAENPICYGVLKPGPYVPNGISLVRILDIENDVVAPTGLFRISDALDRMFARSRLDGGEVLVSIQGTIGRIAVAPSGLQGANISRTIARVSVGPRCGAAYLRHWMLSTAGQRILADSVVGTTRASLNIGTLRQIAFPLPPAAEQSRIAEVLDTVDEAIRTTELVIAKLEQVKRGLLHDLLTCGINDNGEIRDPARHPEQFQDTPLGQIPKRWKVVPLGAVIAGNPQNGIYKPSSSYGSDGIPIVRIDGFYDGSLEDPAQFKRVRLNPSEVSIYALSTGDLLINRVNSIDYVGKMACVPTLSEPTVFESNIMRLRLDGASLHPQFATLWMCGANAKAHFLRCAKSAIAQVSINQGDVRSLPIPLPSVPEQGAIVRASDRMTTRRSAEEAELEKLRLLKKGLMDDLLTGRVRVRVANGAA